MAIGVAPRPSINVYFRMGLTNVIQQICSYLNFEDRLAFIYSHPELLAMAKTYKSVISGPEVPNDDVLNTIFKYMDELIKHGENRFKRSQIVRKIIEDQSLVTLKFIRRRFGYEYLNIKTIWDDRLYPNEETLLNFMLKIVEENDFELFAYANEYLQKIRIITASHMYELRDQEKAKLKKEKDSGVMYRSEAAIIFHRPEEETTSRFRVRPPRPRPNWHPLILDVKIYRKTLTLKDRWDMTKYYLSLFRGSTSNDWQNELCKKIKLP